MELLSRDSWSRPVILPFYVSLQKNDCVSNVHRKVICVYFSRSIFPFTDGIFPYLCHWLPRWIALAWNKTVVPVSCPLQNTGRTVGNYYSTDIFVTILYDWNDNIIIYDSVPFLIPRNEINTTAADNEGWIETISTPTTK